MLNMARSLKISRSALWLLGLILAVFLVAWIFISQVHEVPQKNTETTGPNLELPALHGASSSTPTMTAASSNRGQEALASSEVRRNKVLSGYLQGGNLASNIHAALTSGDLPQLEYAKLYLQRCEVASVWAKGDIEKFISSESTSAEVKKALTGFLQMCDKPNSDPEMRRLRSALSSAIQRANALQKEGENGLGRDDGELLIEKYYMTRAKKQSTPFDSIGDCATIGGLCEIVVFSAVCEELGCDSRYHMASICGLSYLCTEKSLNEQLETMFGISVERENVLGGKNLNANELWPKMRQNARKVIASLNLRNS